ncbi:calcium-dependent protein kinase [Striga asiatica]|uniref:Calcium-dependent protein kinase n=1 Tax=Striga asiatica TaxID=4170 RepID=A0A5A7QUG5_STRAF|nr:calcium-dependent protein kinase [Striga asiatica]
MGQCYGKTIPTGDNDGPATTITTIAAAAEDLPEQTPPRNGTPSVKNTPARSSANSPWPSPYPSAAGTPAGVSPSTARSTPRRFFKKPFPPPSPAKHIRASLRKLGQRKKPPREGPIPEDADAGESEQQQQHALDKNFGYNKNFGAKYELGKEVGRGHFGHTCCAKGRKGELKDIPLAVKIISKAQFEKRTGHHECDSDLDMSDVKLIKDHKSEEDFRLLDPNLIDIFRFGYLQSYETGSYLIKAMVFMMTTAISIEDVRREVKILKALSGHRHLASFYDACEDSNNVYIIMELCEGGELLDRILAKGGKYSEDEAKLIIVQILSVVSFCHLQGVVHRDLKPENFLFTSRSEDADLKLIDFGLSDFIRTVGCLSLCIISHVLILSDERLNDIVGSAYYVAPEVLHRSYSVEADIWSIGVIAYILLCGSRPFWARTESGIFRAVLRADPNFEDLPWPSVSLEAKDFVRRLLNKDYRKRMTAAQALTHPWLRSESHPIPLDILVYKLVKSYLHATPFKRAALKALSKALTEDELIYLRAQFMLLEPSEDGRVSLENFRKISGSSHLALSLRNNILLPNTLELCDFQLLFANTAGLLHFSIFQALARNATDALNMSRVPDILNSMAPLSFRRMDLEEFCAAAISTYQLEALENWEQIASTAFEFFEQEGNRAISVEELARELNVGPSAHPMLRDWLRRDGKLSLVGYTKFLHGLTLRSSNMRHH